jgi:anti-sigma factor RsiW
MTRCWEKDVELQRWAAGELADERRVALESHLADCASCRRDLAAYRHLYEVLSGVSRREPPGDLHFRLMAALRPYRVALKMRRESRASALTRKLIGAGVGVAFAAALTASLWSWLGRIFAYTGRTLSPDLETMWTAAKQAWSVVLLLNEVAGKVAPKAGAFWSAVRGANEPVLRMAPVLLAAYGVMLFLGASLCWRALHARQERRWGR